MRATTEPAAAMRSSSRRDLRRITTAPARARPATRSASTSARSRAPSIVTIGVPELAVVLAHGPRLLLEDAPRGCGSTSSRSSSRWYSSEPSMSQMPGHRRRCVGHVVGVARLAADEAPGQTPHELVAVHLDVEHARDPRAALGQQAVERSGLVERAREAVEHEAARPRPAARCARASMPIVTSSGTSSPRSMYERARRPSSLSLRRCSRNMSPVAMCGTPLAAATAAAWVPLPAPGGPNRSTASIPLYFLRTPS